MPSWLLPALSGACVMLVIVMIAGWGIWRVVVKLLAEWVGNAL